MKSVELESGALLPNIVMTVDGEPLDLAQLVSVEAWSEADRIPRGRLIFMEGTAEGEALALSLGDALGPGGKVVVAAGYGSSAETVHSGVVVRQSIRIRDGSLPQVVIETADPLIEMTLATASAVSQQTSHRDAAAALVAAAGGIVGRNEADETPHEALVQYRASAWDTLLLHARASGCVVVVEGGKVDIVRPVGGTSELELTYGEDILAFDCTDDGSGVRGSVRFQGTSAAKVGSSISVRGIGARFGGDVFVTALRHEVEAGRWATTAEFRSTNRGWTREDLPGAHSRAAPTPSQVGGLQIGTVVMTAPDPSGQHRVQVSLPLNGEWNGGVWARLSSFYASRGFGATFYPEVGDEVVLGFMEGDPARPIVLGSLYSAGRVPAEGKAPDELNLLKGIVSRQGLQILFDEKETVLTLRTPGGRSIRLDDGAKEIEISDVEGNRISMTRSMIDIAAAGELRLSAATNLSISAGVDLNVEAKHDYALSAGSIKQKAMTEVAIESSATAQLKASALLTIKGALVNIN